MSRACVLLAAALLAPAAHAGEVAFVEVDVVDSCFVQEAVRLRLRFGLDEEYAAANMIQPFRRELDVPVRLQAPWLQELRGATPGPSLDGGAPGFTCALNDDVARAARIADTVRDGRSFAVYEIERDYRFDEPGQVELSAPVLQYSYATRFEDDFVQGRVALDPETTSVGGHPRTLTVRPLPDAGRTAAFTGGVGRFTVRATATPTTLARGETLKLKLEIEGEGNLGQLRAPGLDALAGFHVYGALDDGAAPVRTITYDLSPRLDALTEIPAIPFSYFDPTPPAGYRTVHTSPIALEVRPIPPLPGEPGTPPEVALPGVAGAFGAWLSLTVVGLAAAGLAVLLAVALLLMRRRRRRLEAVGSAPDAAASFGARAVVGGTSVADAFVEYLAARLDCPPASVIDPGLASRLAAVGVPAGIAARTAGLVEALVAARYGGEPPAGAAEACREVIAELERQNRG